MLSSCLFQQNTRKHTHTHVHMQHTCSHMHVHAHTHTCSDPRKPLPSCYPHACSSKKHAGMHTHVHTQHTCTHTHARTCTLAMILEGPFFHVIPMPVPAKHMQAHTHTCVHAAHARTHTCTLAMILEGPFFHVIPMPVPAKHTQAHTHTHADSAHICMHTHAQSSRAFVLLLPIAPSSVSFTTGPTPRKHSSARGLSHHTLPFSTMSHTTSR